MLKVADLKAQIKSGLTEIYKPAMETMLLMLFPEKTEQTDQLAKDMAEAFDEMTSDAFADVLSAAIDYYVKTISITGMLITTGSPSTHTCTIAPADKPIKAGKIPNTLGIS